MHFTAAGVACHAYLHGSRRGSLQQLASDVPGGCAHEGLLAQIKTPSIQALYVGYTYTFPLIGINLVGYPEALVQRKKLGCENGC